VQKLRGPKRPEPVGIILTAPGEEAQVDYGSGPMVRDAQSGKYRRMRLFILTLGYSRKSVRLLAWRSSVRTWAELHEQAFRRLGGCPRVIVLDNLREGLAGPDIYDPTINPLFRDVLAHYGVVALPCRIQDPDRKGKVESGIGHTRRTPLKGMRFESLEEGQAYLDRWEQTWADTRIHGTTKRQVAAMFSEEKPHLLPLPLEPFRHYQYGERIVHLDGCVEVEAAYYSLPPGWIGRSVRVQWDALHVRILHPTTNQLLREHLRQKRGGCHIEEEDHPKKMPLSAAQLLRRAAHAGTQTGKFCQLLYDRQGETAIRRILGVLSLMKKYGTAAVEDACAAALDIRGVRIPFRAPLSGAPAAPPSVPAADRSADPRTYRVSRFHQSQNQGATRMNLIELNRALRQLRLGGIAAVLETRLQQAQAEPMAPIDFLSCLVSDELQRRGDRLLERRRKQAQFRDPQRTLDNFDFTFNKKMNRSLVFDLATAAFVGRREDALFLGPPDPDTYCHTSLTH
jgi:hypothetical protein